MTTSTVETPSRLMHELVTLNERIKNALLQEHQALQLERAQLELSSKRLQENLSERQWRLERDRHALAVQKQEYLDLKAETTLAAAEDVVLTLQADGGAIQTLVRTVTEGREPESILAERVRAQARMLAVGQPVELRIDRDAATLHWVVSWLRDGQDTLAAMPPAILEAVGKEARHWRMRDLFAQIEERLGLPAATHEARPSAEWFAAELAQAHAPRLAMCRALAKQLRHWLAGGREAAIGASRRALGASHLAGRLPEALLGAMEAHSRDLPLLLSGLGCWLLWSSCLEGRRAIRLLYPRLTSLLEECEAAVREERANVASAVAERAALPAHLLRAGPWQRGELTLQWIQPPAPAVERGEELSLEMEAAAVVKAAVEAALAVAEDVPEAGMPQWAEGATPGTPGEAAGPAVAVAAAAPRLLSQVVLPTRSTLVGQDREKLAKELEHAASRLRRMMEISSVEQ